MYRHISYIIIYVCIYLCVFMYVYTYLYIYIFIHIHEKFFTAILKTVRGYLHYKDIFKLPLGDLCSVGLI